MPKLLHYWVFGSGIDERAMLLRSQSQHLYLKQEDAWLRSAWLVSGALD
ncbi:MAG: hypothetical protein ABI861_13125 [Panacibacter sp.]